MIFLEGSGSATVNLPTRGDLGQDTGGGVCVIAQEFERFRKSPIRSRPDTHGDKDKSDSTLNLQNRTHPGKGTQSFMLRNTPPFRLSLLTCKKGVPSKPEIP